ncbi:MAG: excisionase family DNA-binding protein [Candidatus Angelobacter sp.]|jgi:excisionase family DNA binding protein
MNAREPQLRISTLPARRRLLRTKEAAEYLSVSPWKLRRLIQDGRLPVVQDGDGSPFLLDVRDLDGYIDRNKRTLPF